MAQLLPKEGKTLNYRIIGFRTEGETIGASCDLEIAMGNHNSEGPFKENLIKTVKMTDGKVVAEVPSFGRQYTWRTVMQDGAKKKYSAFHHFSTGFSPVIDTAQYRLRIIKPATKFRDAYVFLDGNRALYDMNGNPVWYLPDSDGANNNVNDLKITPQGTITCLLDDNAHEVDFNGRLLWRAPDSAGVNGEKKERYNHQFSRLRDGNYMVIGSERAYIIRHMLPGGMKNRTVADSITKIPPDDSIREAAPYGTLIEYDQSGKVVWCWRCLSYFKDSGIGYRPLYNGILEYNLHQNAFYFDEKNKVIYLSLRIGSFILKIAYPDGKVLASYGDSFKPGAPEVRSGLFCGQHACNVDADGELYLLNNNAGDTLALPGIVVLDGVGTSNTKLEKKWEFTFPVESDIAKGASPRYFQTGGNVTELPDHSFFASLPTVDSKVFIVGRDKKILWEATPEKWVAESAAWMVCGQYRASIVCTRQELERLIWNQ